MYCIGYLNTSRVNEVGQKVDTGNKELYYCNYVCSSKYVEHSLVKRKMIFIKQSKQTAEQLEKGYEHGEISTLILIHYYEAIINFIRGKINEKTFKIFAQDAMEVGNQMSDNVYLSIVRDTQYAIAMMA
jgi:hypothetical protein